MSYLSLSASSSLTSASFHISSRSLHLSLSLASFNIPSLSFLPVPSHLSLSESIHIPPPSSLSISHPNLPASPSTLTCIFLSLLMPRLCCQSTFALFPPRLKKMLSQNTRNSHPYEELKKGRRLGGTCNWTSVYGKCNRCLISAAHHGSIMPCK